MIILIALIAAIALLDLYADWVTPYLAWVECERGDYVALGEALRILSL